MKINLKPSKPVVYPWDQNRSIKSQGDPTGAATKPVNPLRYTGNKMLGVATMHKSNAVPVFTDEQAKDLATMRRN